MHRARGPSASCSELHATPTERWQGRRNQHKHRNHFNSCSFMVPKPREAGREGRDRGRERSPFSSPTRRPPHGGAWDRSAYMDMSLKHRHWVWLQLPQESYAPCLVWGGQFFPRGLPSSLEIIYGWVREITHRVLPGTAFLKAWGPFLLPWRDWLANVEEDLKIYVNFIFWNKWHVWNNLTLRFTSWNRVKYCLLVQ